MAVQGQTTPLFPPACQLNILIVLDRSDSVKGGFNKSRNFVIDVSAELQIGPHAHQVRSACGVSVCLSVQMAMIVYSGLSYRREVFKWNFAKNNEEFVRITNNLRAIGGTTNTRKAGFSSRPQSAGTGYSTGADGDAQQDYSHARHGRH